MPFAGAPAGNGCRPWEQSLGRRSMYALLLCCAAPLISSCDSSPRTAVVDVSLFSYLDRPIFDVLLNGKDIGASLAHGFNGANSSMIGERITLGPQVITWRLGGPQGTPRNGETVRAKNTPVLAEIPQGVTWIAVHVYDDDTVEITFSTGAGGDLSSARGTKIIEQWRAAHGQH